MTSKPNLGDYIEDYIMWNHAKEIRIQTKLKNLRFYRLNKLIFGTLTFSPWGMLATMWMHLEAPKKI